MYDLHAEMNSFFLSSCYSPSSPRMSDGKSYGKNDTFVVTIAINGKCQKSEKQSISTGQAVAKPVFEILLFTHEIGMNGADVITPPTPPIT